jgi:hypothetical protein
VAVIHAAEVYRLVQSGRYGGDILIQNAWHFGRENPGGTPGELMNDWNTNIVGPLADQLHQVMTLTDVQVQRIAPDESEIERISGSRACQATGYAALPSVAAGVITWRTQLPGRSRRGRSYIAGLPYDLITIADGAVWNTPGINRLTAIANLIRSRYMLGGNPGAYMLGVWSTKLGGKPPTADAATGWVMVTGFTAQAYICSMRSRRFGAGL